MFTPQPTQILGLLVVEIAVRLDIQSSLNDINADAQHLRVMINLIREHQGWKKLTGKKGYAFMSFEAFCVAPQPFGLGYATQDIDAILRERTEKQSPEKRAEEAKPLGEHGGDRKAEDQVNDINSIPSNKTGPTSDYLVSRIARDYPDILDRMKAGEFPSVRKAALEAGILKPMVTVPIG